ncbi:MAG: DNA gyrase modulator, partial [Candidatus Bathyarchaeia archaeon]
MRDLLELVVESGLKKGASFCEVRYFEERGSSVSVENGVAKILSSGILRGIGVRVSANKCWGFAST